MATYIINTQTNLKGTVEQMTGYLMWHITEPIKYDVSYGPEDGIPATWVDEKGVEQVAVIKTNAWGTADVALDENRSFENAENYIDITQVNIISAKSGYTTQLRYPRYLGEGITFISPEGSDLVNEMVCVNVIALVKDGKKYWLTPETYAKLGYPSHSEVSLSIFHSYPDGTTSIVVSGVTIPPRSTATICPKPGSDTTILMMLGAGVGLGLILLYYLTQKKEK